MKFLCTITFLHYHGTGNIQRLYCTLYDGQTTSTLLRLKTMFPYSCLALTRTNFFLRREDLGHNNTAQPHWHRRNFPLELLYYILSIGCTRQNRTFTADYRIGAMLPKKWGFLHANYGIFYMLITSTLAFGFLIRKFSKTIYPRENVFIAGNLIFYLGEMLHSIYHTRFIVHNNEYHARSMVHWMYHFP